MARGPAVARDLRIYGETGRACRICFLRRLDLLVTVLQDTKVQQSDEDVNYRPNKTDQARGDRKIAAKANPECQHEEKEAKDKENGADDLLGDAWRRFCRRRARTHGACFSRHRY